MSAIRTRKISVPKTRASRQSAQAAFWVRMGVLTQVFVFLLCVGGMYYYNVSLSEKLTKTARETAQIKRDIHEFEREIATLRIKKERYSEWSHISAQIDRFRLGLQQSEPRQRYSIVIYRVAEPEAGQRVITAQR